MVQHIRLLGVIQEKINDVSEIDLLQSSYIYVSMELCLELKAEYDHSTAELLGSQLVLSPISQFVLSPISVGPNSYLTVLFSSTN